MPLSRKLFIVWITLVVLIVGCGGGGGGSLTGSTTGVTGTTSGTTGNPPGPATYTTTWLTPASGTPAGKSQRVTVTDLNGDVISQQIVNYAAAPQTVNVSGALAGTFILRVELNSALNFAGTTTGILETKIIPNFIVQTVVGPPVKSVQLNPTSLALDVSQADHVCAAGLDANNRLTFLQTGSLTWNASGSSFSVDNQGNIKGVSVGSGSISATYAPLARSFSLPVNVSPADWTVLIFLNSSNDLYPYAVPNLQQMESVTSGSSVRFVVEWKLVEGLDGNSPSLFNATRRYMVTHDSTGAVSCQLVQDMGTGVDMGSATTLNTFIKWGQANYPANHYALVVWNHGNGWERAAGSPPPTRGVSYDDQTGNAIQTWQLPQALQGTHLDILSYDACLMQMLEVATETMPYSDYIATSEENTPGPGYPYDRVFAPFFQTPTATPAILSYGFVVGHVDYPPYQDQPVTQSVLITSKIPALETAVDQLAGALIANVGSLQTIVPNIRNTALKYATRGDEHNYYDLYQVCQMLQSSSAPGAVQTAAANVMTAVSNAVLYTANTPADAGSHGISIDLSPGTYFTEFEQTDYSQLQLAQTTRWGKWLAVSP